jgi:hypothetical protein
MASSLAQDSGAAEKKARLDPSDASSQLQQVQELVASKRYFVPVGQVTKRRKLKVVVLLLIVLISAGVAAVILVQ